ncbi:MAG TPA: thioesterase family protein [Vicinamibacterales bacterium]|nr:thioesterase family protein [Vicinamibacterales bacterium]
MAVSSHRYRRRVEFADTDMAGVAHFSWIARYMEEAEHALWRAAGLSIVPPDHALGFPRVAVSMNFKAPLYFEDEFEVDVRITAISSRSVSYSHTITRGDTVIATGTMTAACVRKIEGKMQATELPLAILDRLAVHA